MNNLEILVKRLKKIGIKLELAANYPWIYLVKVNGKLVTEIHFSEYGYVIALHGFKTGNINIINEKELFQIIRKYK